MNPRQLRQNLIKCKHDAVQLKDFGDNVDTFCCIKDDVETVDTMMVTDYIFF